MKKFFTLVLLTVFAMAMFMTSCQSSEFAVVNNDDNTLSITAENAGDDMSGTSGGLQISDKDEVIVTPSLEQGEITVEFFDASGFENKEELPDDENLEAQASVTVSGTEETVVGLKAGEYMVRATGGEKATGTVEISIRTEGLREDWAKASSTDEAGEKGGVGLFLVDPSGTSLGPVINADYCFTEGAAEAHYGVAAVELYVRKGLNSYYGGDVSLDENEYAHEWTQTVAGKEVKCFGNREGEATKTIWTDGEYDYAVLAYGAGGDTDYGLNADDLATLLADIQ